MTKVKSIDDYLEYLGKISTKLMDKDGVYSNLTNNIQGLFEEYGFTNVEKAQVMAQIDAAAVQYLDQFSTAGAIELIKTDKANELVDKQKDKIDAEIRLIEQQLLLMKCQTTNECKQAAIIDAQLVEAEKKIELMDQEIEESKFKVQMMECQTKNECARSILIPLQAKELSEKIQYTKQQILKITADIDMVNCSSKNECDKNALIPVELKRMEAQTEDIEQKTKLTQEQQELVKRQTANYNDTLLVKAAEFQGGVASYALNAAATSMDEAVKEFNKTISLIKGRS